MDAFGGQVVDLHPARLDEGRRRPAAAVQHRRKHGVQPQGGHRRGVQHPLLRRKAGQLFQGLGGAADGGAAHLGQLLADQPGRRLQGKDIGRTRGVRRQDDVSQGLPLEGKAHQAAQIVPVGGQVRAGCGAAVQPDAGQGAVGPGVLRLDGGDLPFRLRVAALQVPAAAPRLGQGRLRQGLLPVAEKGGIPRDATGLSSAGQILDVAHQKPFFIVLGRDIAPRRALGLGAVLNRTRHCSPARPAGRP